MGYLQHFADAINPLGLANFSKAVISLWFRVPSATFLAMDALPDSLPGDSQGTEMTGANLRYYPPMIKLLPLITFGSVEIDYLGNEVQPSFIGIDCFQSKNCVCCNLQTPVSPSLTVDPTGPSFPAEDPLRPACFYMSGGARVSTNGSSGKLLVDPDVWNHILLSFDISHSETADYDYVNSENFSPRMAAINTFTWAFNDVSKVDFTMYPSGGINWVLNGIESSDIIISDALTNLGGYIGFHEENEFIPPIQGDFVNWPGGYIKSLVNPIGMPSDDRFVDKILQVDMAHLQVYTGVTCDARDPDVRRHFVTEDGRPEVMAAAATLLGRSPKIYFKNYDDWNAGNNRGTGGSFVKVGTINPFTPGPQLGA